MAMVDLCKEGNPVLCTPVLLYLHDSKLNTPKLSETYRMVVGSF